MYEDTLGKHINILLDYFPATHKNDVPVVCADIRKVFYAPDYENAKHYLNEFVDKYR